MHELSITEGILNIAVSEAAKRNAVKVTVINLVIGSMSSIVPECVQEYFDILSEDTVAFKAKLNFTIIPARVKCRECGMETEIKHFSLRCSACNSQKVDLTAGNEFYVDSMEIEE